MVFSQQALGMVLTGFYFWFLVQPCLTGNQNSCRMSMNRAGSLSACLDSWWYRGFYSAAITSQDIFSRLHFDESTHDADK